MEFPDRQRRKGERERQRQTERERERERETRKADKMDRCRGRQSSREPDMLGASLCTLKAVNMRAG